MARGDSVAAASCLGLAIRVRRFSEPLPVRLLLKQGFSRLSQATHAIHRIRTSL
jgi:hypothetical protein